MTVEGQTYTDMTDTNSNMEFNYTGLTNLLNGLVEKIDAVADKAKDNENANTALNKSYETISGTWQTLSTTVSKATVYDSNKTAINNALKTEKTNLEDFKKELDSDFAKGLAATNQKKHEATLKKIGDSISVLSNNWNKSEYGKAVSADNLARKNEFDAAYKSLTDTYLKYVAVVTEMSKTSFASKVTDKLVELTGENGLFSYAEKISALKSKAEGEYYATVTSTEADFYDYEQENKKTAEGYEANIKEISEKYCTAVNDIAKSEYDADVAAAQKLYSDALSDIQSTTTATETEAKAALKNVSDILTDASALKDQYDNYVDNMAVQYEKTYKAQLDATNINDLIAADKLAVANTVWNDRLKEASTLASSESKEIAEFKIPTTADYGNKDYVKEYADRVAYIGAATEAWDKIADADKYTNFATAYDILKSYIGNSGAYVVREINKVNVTHTDIYWNAYDANEHYKTNDEWYNKMLVDIADLQAALYEEQKFAEDMIVAREMDVLVGQYQDDIDETAKIAAAYHDSYTSSEDTYTALKSAIDSNKKLIQYPQNYGIKYETIVKENERIVVVLGQLNLDYVNATATEEGLKDADKYKKILEGYKTENESIYGTTFLANIGKAKTNEEKHAVINKAKEEFLALEGKIAATKNELTALYNDQANATAQKNLQDAIDALNTTKTDLDTQLADCHDPVVKAYESTVEEMGKAIETVQTRLDEVVAESTVLLYKDVISENITKVKNTYAGLDTKIADMEDPYDVNDAKYKELCGVIEKLTDSLQIVYDKTADFIPQSLNYEITEGVENWQIVRDYEYKNLMDQIERQQNKIDSLNATGTGLVGSTMFEESGGIQSTIVKYESKLSYYNAQQLINSTTVDKSLAYQLADVKKTIAGNVYSENYKDTLDLMVKNISSEIKSVDEWNELFMKRDQDGNKKFDPNPDDGIEEEVTAFTAYYLYGDEKNDAAEGSSYTEWAEYYKGTTPYLAVMNHIAKIQVAVDELKEAAKKVVGDADGDGVIGVNDYTYIVNVIMESSLVDIPEPGTEAFKLADANCDGKIDVADAVSVVNAILGKTLSSSAAVRRTTLYDAGSSMSLVGEGSGYSQRIALNLNTSLRFVGGQIDVVLPEGMTVEGASLGDRASSLELRSATLKSGVTRLLISSIENNEIEGTEGAVAYIDVNVTPSYKGQAVELSSAVFADAAGRKYSIGLDGEATGISTVTTTEYIKGKVYSVGGQVLDGLKNGVNIIRNTDGSSKKVLVK